MDHPTVNISNLTANRTALVLVPPKEFAERLNPFRLTHDKSAARWTAHITLHFSFVDIPNFSQAIDTIEQGLSRIEPFTFKLNGVGSFSLSGYETVHLTVSDDTNIQRIWAVVAKALNYATSGRPLTPHVTLGQAPHNNPEASASLRRKAQRALESVSSIEWPVRSVVFLKKDEGDAGIMKRCHEVFLRGESRTSFVLAPSNPTVHHDGNRWTFCDSPLHLDPLPSSSPLSIATYNILHDDLFPTPPRLPHLIKTILSADTVHAAAATAMPADIDKLFEDAGGIVPYGPTYGPLRNPLAAATMRESAVPQRYVRVYVRKRGRREWVVVKDGILRVRCCLGVGMVTMTMGIGIHLVITMVSRSFWYGVMVMMMLASRLRRLLNQHYRQYQYQHRQMIQIHP